MHIAGVHHLAVSAPDLAASTHFYTEVLGLPVLRRFAHPDGSPRSVWVALPDGAFLAVESGPAPSGDPGWCCVALAIDVRERDAWRARLDAAGHPIERESDYTLYVRDPGGALLGLSHYPTPR